jgi:hypothetical protein
MTIETPPADGWRWRLRWPDGQLSDAIIEQGDGSAIEIDDWVALGGGGGAEASVPEWSWLVSVYGGAQDADAGQVLTAVGDGSATWQDAPESGVPEPSSHSRSKKASC